MLRSLLRYVRLLWTLKRRQAELDEEIQFHLSEEADERGATGLPVEQARLAARKDFGNVALIREDTREVWGWASTERWLQDLRYGLRMMRRHPSFTAAAVMSLALGIGANTAIFSVVDAALLNPIPFAEPDRMVAIHGTSPSSNDNPLSYPNFLDVRTRTRTFEDVAAWRIEMFTLAGQPQSERLIGGRVSASYFSVLRVQPLLGRAFTVDEDRLGGPPVVVLGERLWRRRFAADTRVVGQPVRLDGTPYTVIGVMPAHVGVGVIARRYDDVFLPIGQYGDEVFLSRHVNATAAIARLRAGVDIAEARAEMDTVAAALATAFPEANKGVGINVQPLAEDLVDNLKPTLTLLVAAVMFVLLIACANVSNLILARFTSRSQEFALRAALGAGRARILRQALTESVCIALAGGAVGVAIAAWGTSAMLSVVPSALPHSVTVGMNRRVLLVAAAAAILSGLLCAVVPALRATRPNLGQGVRQNSQHGSTQRHRAQHAFLVTQVALTLVLLVGAGLMARSLVQVWRVDPGFDPGVVTFMTGLPSERANDPEQVRVTVRQVAERIARVPGVQAASAVFGALPYTGNNNAVDFWRADESKPVGSDAALALFSAVGPDYFRAMGIAVLEGRAFAPQDTSRSMRVAMVDAAFAASVFPGEEPLGQSIRLEPLAEPVEVIGVVRSVKYWGLDGGGAGRARLQVYVPDAQLPDSLAPMAARGFSVVARSSRPAAETLKSMREALREYDSGQVMINETPLREGIVRALAGRRFSLILMGTFALLALALSTVGIYGLASYLAVQRTQEIGVRIALGAQRHDIVQALLGPVGRMAAIGIGIGLLASLGLARLVAGMFFNTSPADPLTLGGVAGLLAAVTLIASYLPVRRMLRVDPLIAIRHE